MKRRKTGPIVFGIFLLLDALAAGWIVYENFHDTNTLVSLKLAIFSSFVGDRESFVRAIESPDLEGFAVDPKPLVERYSREIEERVGTIEPLPPDPVERARAIVKSFSKNGGGGCGLAMPLVNKIAHVSEGTGNGCCSDHSEVFLALSEVYGLKSREISAHFRHVFNEFFDPQSGKWLYIDPQYAVMASDGQGHYLSLFELRERYQRGESFEFDFFGNENHVFAGQDPRDHPYFDAADDFPYVMLTMGRNVFENDVFNQRLQRLPKVLRQFIGLSFGPTPGYLVLDDSPLSHRFRRMKQLFLCVTAILVVGTLLYPTQRAIGGLRRSGAS